MYDIYEYLCPSARVPSYIKSMSILRTRTAVSGRQPDIIPGSSGIENWGWAGAGCMS